MGSSLKEGFVWVRIPAHGLKFQSELNSFMYSRLRTTSKAAHSPTQVWKPLSYRMLTLSHAELKLVFICWLLPTACGILAPWPGIEPLPPAVLSTGPPRKSPSWSFFVPFSELSKIVYLGKSLWLIFFFFKIWLFSCFWPCWVFAAAFGLSLVVVHVFSHSQERGSAQTGDQTHVPCIARQILNHWSTREALAHFFTL